MAEESAINFRRTYYKSLGVKEACGSLVKELEEYLKADVIDIEQLKQFCLRASLPIFYRPHVWKLILNSEPAHKDQETYDFIMSQRRQQYHDLEHALHVLTAPVDTASDTAVSVPDKIVPDTTVSHTAVPIPDTIVSDTAIPDTTVSDTAIPDTTVTCTANTVVYMYCLETGYIGAVLRDANLYRNLCAMATPFIDKYTNNMDIYFTYSGFVCQWQQVLQHGHLLNTQFDSELSKRNADLHHHLVVLGGFTAIPLQRWFGQCFASDLPASEREILWDRVIAGSSSVVVYVALAILLFNTKVLLQTKRAQEVANLLDKLSANEAPLIVTRGIEMWEGSGSPLCP